MAERDAWRHARTVMLATAIGALVGAAHGQYLRSDLVSDGSVPAAHVDPNLVNGWGIAFNPAGFVWVSCADSGVSTLYDGNGVPQSLVVTIPTPSASTGGSPTGIVYSASPLGFVVNSGMNSAPSRFLFATEQGVIAGWSPFVFTSGSPPSTEAFVVVDHSASGAIYKGLAIGGTFPNERLYAADFHNAVIEVYDSSFTQITSGIGFADPSLPAGYAPFNIQNVDGNFVVAYAKQDALGEDEVAGKGLGYVDIYDANGLLLMHLASQGALNAPWGVAKAPSDFGELSGAYLIGNFGDGVINAYHSDGTYLGALRNTGGATVAIDGLWGMSFGNGVNNQPTNTLFYAAGPNGEAAGLYGRLDVGILGDYNGDGHVNGADLGFLLGNWGTPNADLNGDGDTNGADLGILLGNWTG